MSLTAGHPKTQLARSAGLRRPGTHSSRTRSPRPTRPHENTTATVDEPETTAGHAPGLPQQTGSSTDPSPNTVAEHRAPDNSILTDAHGGTVAAPLLYTPEQAAALLQVRPSWLRRKAAARAVPCRFVGKHLRFSHNDITAIADSAAT
jgi:hypothetical protein